MCEYCGGTHIGEKVCIKTTSVSMAKAKATGCNIEAPYSKEQEAIKHLLGRLRGATDQKRKDLEVQFGIVDDKKPVTMQEVVDRIKAGKYLITDKGKAVDKLDPCMPLYNMASVTYFRWRDPQKLEDRDGFDAAIKRRDEAYTKAMSIIHVKSADEGLAAVEAFESQSFWS